MTVAGTPLLITLKFVNEQNGQPADPSEIALSMDPVRRPAIVVTTGQLTRVVTGTWTYEWDTTDLPGSYMVQAQGRGALLLTTDPVFIIIDPVDARGLQ
jgi:hypothetical protein